MSAHTPGPWALDGEGTHVAVVSSAVGITAPSVSRFDRPDDDRIDADACLIAAAPELLDALKEMAALYDGVSDLISTQVMNKVRRAREAIAKAEGRT